MKNGNMIMNHFVLTISILFSITALGSRVAVTDSGTDFSHEWLASRALVNAAEKPWNMVDDDRNGKVDDVNGWNFAEDYSEVFYPDHLTYVSERVYKIFGIIGRIQGERATQEDERYWKEEVQNLPQKEKEELMAELNFFGQYAHGTHVSGIIAQIAPDSKILSARVFPDTPPENMGTSKKEGNVELQGVADFFYKILAAVSNGTFEKASVYLKEREVEVANYSLGVSLQTIAKAALAIKGNKTPTAEQLAVETKRIYAQYEPLGRAWISASPQTLFVVAAGNDGSDNDLLPAFPANLRMDNSISVAASFGFSKIASFSNFGRTTVDVAAPGVAIQSSVPSLNKKAVLAMSGTSMAAPYVTGVAARIKDFNSQLSPKQVKQILMETVDKKDWLQDKVISGGVVNAERAYWAAQNSKTMPLAEAIASSRQAVNDQVDLNQLKSKRSFKFHKSSVVREMESFAREVIF